METGQGTSVPTAKPKRGLLLLLIASMVLAILSCGGWLLYSSHLYEKRTDITGLFESNQLAEVVERMDYILGSEPSSPYARVMKARARALQSEQSSTDRIGIAAEAEVLVRGVLDTSPNYTEAKLILGDALALQGKYEEAHTAYAEMIAMNRFAADVMAHNARAYEWEGKTEEARAEYVASLAVDPNERVALIGKARLDLAAGNTESAEGGFQKVVDTTAYAWQRAEAATSLGTIYLETDAGRALAYFHIAASDATYGPAFAGRARAFLALGAKEDALKTEYLTKALLDAGRASSMGTERLAMQLLEAEAFSALGQYDAARVMLTSARASIEQDVMLSSAERASLSTYADTLHALLGEPSAP